MLSTSMIILRVLFGIAVFVAAILPRFVAVSENRRTAAILTAIGAAILLLILRFAMRASMPERLPPSTG